MGNKKCLTCDIFLTNNILLLIGRLPEALQRALHVVQAPMPFPSQFLCALPSWFRGLENIYSCSVPCNPLYHSQNQPGNSVVRLMALSEGTGAQRDAGVLTQIPQSTAWLQERPSVLTTGLMEPNTKKARSLISKSCWELQNRQQDIGVKCREF